jgi:hypothetical protein
VFRRDTHIQSREYLVKSFFPLKHTCQILFCFEQLVKSPRVTLP